MTKNAVNTVQMSPHPLTRRASGLMALEQRFMFDGAAVADAVDKAIDVQVVAPAVIAPSESLVQAELRAELLVSDFLARPDAREQLFAMFNGGTTEAQPSAEWQRAVDQLLAGAEQGDLNLRVELRRADELQGAKGAFSATGTTGEPTVYLNADWVATADSESVAIVLTEEIGHYLDNAINGDADTAGDEGEVFARFVVAGAQPLSVSFLSEQNDHVVLNVDGQNVAAEMASFNFVNAYEMVYDRNNNTNTLGVVDGAIDTDERWASKEQNSHFFNASVSLGVVCISDGTNGENFSGNDVSASTVIVGGNTYHGWVSRPIKAGGVVRGFYFWTDTRFVSLAAAQADGNQDGDSTVLNNRGFVFVVDQAWFNTQIAAGATGVTINNNKDGNDGAITVANVGSSSDRVDSALNSTASPVANAVPTAHADLANGAPSSTLSTGVGNAAQEQGLNTNPNPDVVLTAAINGSGNVLFNDTDPNADALTVSTVTSKLSGTTTSATSSGVDVLGQYGTLNIKSTGSWTYTPDNTNPAVNALLTGNLQEQFTYTAIDGKGGTATATLTVQINGSNDAPVAAIDYNTAKESTTVAGSTFAYTGYSATGNVLSNDKDVDTGDTQRVSGLTMSGSVTVGAGGVVVVAGSSQLVFTGGSGFNSVSTASEIYIKLSGDALGDSYRGLYFFNGSTYSLVSVSSMTGSTTDANITLTNTPTHYYNAATSSYVRISDSYTSFNHFLATNTRVLFENSTSTTENANGGKDAVVSSSTSTGHTTLSPSSGSVSGTIAAGMTVSGTGVPAGTTVSELTFTSGVLTSIKLSAELTSTAGTSFTFTKAGSVAQSIAGAHGFLVLNADGSYSYTPTTDNGLLAAGESAVEVFDYTMTDTAGQASDSKLYITVFGTGTNDPVLTHDAGTATESGATVGGNTATLGSDATGSVLSNDKESSGAATNAIGAGFVNRVGLQGTGTFTTIDTASNGRTTQQTATVTGAYGSLTINDLGGYTYAVTNSNDAVNALLPGQTLTETFLYEVKNTLTSSGPTWAKLVVTIQGTNDQPVAVADTAAVTEDQMLNATGNVLTNDTDVDGGDTQAVSKVIAGNSTPTTVVTVNTTSASGVLVAGTYGDLTIGADGTYSYVLATAGAQHTALQALSHGVTQTDVFRYEVKDGNGATHTNTLTMVVNGANEAPINQINGAAISSTTSTSVSTAVNTAIDFAGSQLLSVTDADSNLSSITLEVEHGILSFTTAPSNVTLSASTAKSITISAGSQAQLNLALALLRYTPDTNFYGTDFLSISSADANAARDIDGIAINIPTVTTATVSEPALSSGSVSGSAAEGFSGSVTLATGQTIETQQTGNILSGSGAVIGLWQVNTDRTFTVTLTAASNASSSSFVYAVTDIYGNAINNTVMVSITDDSPNATANAKSVNEGLAVTGNVLSDGTADTLGADGAKVTTPAGGVVGVRAAGTDPTSAVTSGVAGSITGLYGTLTLNANGNYSYTAGSNTVTTAQPDVFVYTIEDADGSRSTATLTITVNDASTETISVTGQGPVNEGSLYAMFTVVGSGNQTMNLSVVNGSATLSNPFIEYSSNGTTWITYNGTSNRPVGGTVDVRVGITSESETPAIYEGSETFSLVATNSTNSAITDTGSSSIVDDGTGTKFGPDATQTSTTGLDNDKPQMRIGNVSVEEGSSAIFIVTVGEAAAPYTVTFGASLVNQSAESGDFSSTLVVKAGATVITANGDGSYTVPAGTTALTVEVSTLDDALYEGAETFLLTGKTQFMGSNTTGTGTITDDGTGSDGNDSNSVVDDDCPVFSVADVVVSEGGVATFTVTRTGASAVSQTVDIASLALASPDTAEVNDFTALTTQTLTFAAGVQTQTVTVQTAQDTVYEEGETLRVQLVNPTHGAIMGTASTATGLIVDDGRVLNGVTSNDDRPIASSITVTGGIYNENSPRAVFTVNVNLGQVLTLDVQNEAEPGQAPTGDNEGKPNDSLDTAPIYYSLDGGATWQRYTGPITAGALPVLVAIDITNERDEVYEGEEQLKLVVTSAGRSASGYSSIFDDGTGLIQQADGTTDNTTPKDDDRPAPAPAVLPPEAAIPLAAAPLGLPIDAVTAPPQAFSSEIQPLAPRLIPVEAPIPLRDILTSSSGFRVSVNEAASPGLSLFRGITDQFVEGNGGTKISLPYDAFIHSSKDAVIKLDAKLADNSPLPNWVRFDPATGSFEVNPPKDFKGKLDLKVVALDDDGREATALFQLFVGDKSAEQKPQSRNSLTEKLRLAGQRPVMLIKVGDEVSRSSAAPEVAMRATAAPRASAG